MDLWALIITNCRQKRPREKRVSVKDFKEENRQTLFQSDHQTEEGKVCSLLIK